MKTDVKFQKFQCPSCNTQIEDKGNKLIEKLLFKSIKGKTKFKCPDCSFTMWLFINDMEGKIMPYEIK